MRQALSIVLAAVLLSPLTAAQAPSSEAIKGQVLSIVAGTPVEVRLVDAGKLRGRLGAASDSGFGLQTVKRGKIENAQIPFERVKAIKDTTQKSFGHSLGKGFLIAGIVIATIIATVGIACAATHGCWVG